MIVPIVRANAQDTPRLRSNVTRSVTGCMPTRSVGTISVLEITDRSHAPAW